MIVVSTFFLFFSRSKDDQFHFPFKVNIVYVFSFISDGLDLAASSSPMPGQRCRIIPAGTHNVKKH